MDKNSDKAQNTKEYNVVVREPYMREGASKRGVKCLVVDGTLRTPFYCSTLETVVLFLSHHGNSQ